MHIALIFGSVVAFFVAWLFIPPLRLFALRMGWVDRPDGWRKRHISVTPYMGGIAIAAGFAAGLGFLLLFANQLDVAITVQPLGFWIGAAIMLAVGFYDDAYGLSFKPKLFFQILAACALLLSDYRIDLPFVSADFYATLLTVLWIVGVINAVNFIDGLDGLAGGVIAITFAALAFNYGLTGDLALVALAVPVIGAVAGFLCYNFNPASIFMGDTGSLFLGYMLASYALEGELHADPWLAFLIPFVAFGLPIIDMVLTVFRRLKGKQSVWSPDHDHIHHRLCKLLPMPDAVLVLYSVSFAFGGTSVIMSLVGRTSGLVLALLLGGAVLAGLALLRRVPSRATETTDTTSAGLPPVPSVPQLEYDEETSAYIPAGQEEAELENFN